MDGQEILVRVLKILNLFIEKEIKNIINKLKSEQLKQRVFLMVYVCFIAKMKIEQDYSVNNDHTLQVIVAQVGNNCRKCYYNGGENAKMDVQGYKDLKNYIKKLLLSLIVDLLKRNQVEMVCTCSKLRFYQLTSWNDHS